MRIVVLAKKKSDYPRASFCCFSYCSGIMSVFVHLSLCVWCIFRVFFKEKFALVTKSIQLSLKVQLNTSEECINSDYTARNYNPKVPPARNSGMGKFTKRIQKSGEPRAILSKLLWVFAHLPGKLVTFIKFSKGSMTLQKG